MNTPFEGKVALVTGGNSGIGLATATPLHRRGAKVIISGRDQNTLNDAAAAIGKDTLALGSDVTKLADLDVLFKVVEERVGKIDVLVANAGVAKFASMRT
jgi:NAD(P)-dependent dehydrogenase (short-subunit alcohol dehydrogenase family)